MNYVNIMIQRFIKSIIISKDFSTNSQLSSSQVESRSSTSLRWANCTPAGRATAGRRTRKQSTGMAKLDCRFGSWLFSSASAILLARSWHRGRRCCWGRPCCMFRSWMQHKNSHRFKCRCTIWPDWLLPVSTLSSWIYIPHYIVVLF